MGKTLLNRPLFRIGTTSYILPDDLLPNARFLADQVQDMELVLFDLENGQSNLPGSAEIDSLKQLARDRGMSYTVHLPLDLRLGPGDNEQHISLQKARRVIEATRALDPFAYVLHLDGREVRCDAEPSAMARWQDQSIRVLEIAAGWAGGPERLAVENLESYPLDFLEPLFTRVPVSRCVDIGHLWLDGHDPLPYLARALARTRVIHMHGIAGRDHQSLAHTPGSQIDPVIRFLLKNHYSGVLTLEVFGELDFHASVRALQDSLQRMDNRE